MAIKWNIFYDGNAVLMQSFAFVFEQRKYKSIYISCSHTTESLMPVPAVLLLSKK